MSLLPVVAVAVRLVVVVVPVVTCLERFRRSLEPTPSRLGLVALVAI